MTTPILVIGQSGQLARALADGSDPVHCVGRAEFDLATDDPKPLLDRIKPCAVINAAAYTDVNGAETDPAGASALNHKGPARLAEACSEAGLQLLHVSTDYVFDGADGAATYTETAATAPLNVYGRTKLAGEQAIARIAPDSLILRAAWIYDSRGGSFLNAILKRLDAGAPIKVVDDQISTPTWAPDLAKALLALAQRETPISGLYHFRGGDDASWYDFAQAAIDAARDYLPEPVQIDRVDSNAFPQAAERPKDTRMNADALHKSAGIGAGNWRKGLPEVMARRDARSD